MPQMAFVANAEGDIIYFNKRWYDYVGKEDTKGWNWKEKAIHHPDDLQRTIDTWTKALQTGDNYEIEYRLKRKDGQYRWHLGRAMPVLNKEGKPEFWFGTNTDIHQQKMAESQLKQAINSLRQKNIKLRQMQKLRENMLHFIAHDLRSPLGNMQMGIELLQKVKEEKDKITIQDGLHKMIRQQQNVVAGLVEIIKAQNPEDVEAKDILLEEVVKDILHEYEAADKETGKIVLNFSKAPVICYVPGFIFSILKNLISNAVKYQNDNRSLEIVINSYKQDDYIILSVSDNGSGIDLEKHDKNLFKVFQRLTDRSQGSGVAFIL